MLRTARTLLLFTIAYNVAEGVVALWAGIEAGSISLTAFAFDSWLEVSAAGVVLWRMGIADSERAEVIEHRAVRFIGWTFLVLAAAVLLQSAWSLASRAGAEESYVGIGLAVASVTVMPVLALWKLRIAARGRIASLAIEAKETIACSYLSFTLLAGLVANALLGWWWLDAATAILLVPWLVREGLEGVRGEDSDDEESATLCSCRACLYGLRKCAAACCAG
jgi:divalent metal cation (Fe/Co/Zn/Cd) transporter